MHEAQDAGRRAWATSSPWDQGTGPSFHCARAPWPGIVVARAIGSRAQVRLGSGDKSWWTGVSETINTTRSPRALQRVRTLIKHKSKHPTGRAHSRSTLTTTHATPEAQQGRAPSGGPAAARGNGARGVGGREGERPAAEARPRPEGSRGGQPRASSRVTDTRTVRPISTNDDTDLTPSQLEVPSPPTRSPSRAPSRMSRIS